MADSVNKILKGNLNYAIRSDGEEIKPSEFQLMSVVVRKEVNKIGKAELVFEAGDMSKGEVSESENDAFLPGKKIVIQMGYGNTYSTIFEGSVTSHKFSVDKETTGTLNIECRDFAFPATQEKGDDVYKKKKDSDIIQELFSKCSDLSVDVEDTKIEKAETIRKFSTHWDYALSLSNANGLLIVTEGGECKIKKPDVSAAPAIKATYGDDIIDFKGELVAAGQKPTIIFKGWDDKEQKMITATGKKPSLNEQGSDTMDDLSGAVGVQQEIVPTVFSSQEELEALADAEMLKTGLARIQGTCTICGTAALKHGDTLELCKVGKHFNGTAFVGSVEHKIDESGWITIAGLGLPLSNLNQHSGNVPQDSPFSANTAKGLLIGVVTKIDADDEQKGKIQVQLPYLANSDTGLIWARIANFWASKDYGAFFIPDVGDEVILGFLDNDITYPVILGSLYSKARPAANVIEKENKIRSITTKSKMKIEFEEEKKIITITTPGKNTITMSDDAKGIQLEDQNSNKIAMNDSGIVIESSKSITLKSKADIVLEPGANFNVKAKGNVTMKGVNIEAAANAKAVVKGNAQAEFSASGQTVIKGGVVMIN